MENNQIIKNFEFLYHGYGRHLCGDPIKYEKPLRVLLNLEGREKVSINDSNLDYESMGMRGADIIFKVFEFSKSTRAYYYQEERPANHPENPVYIIRVRIANYKMEDGIGAKISNELQKIPKNLDSVVE